MEREPRGSSSQIIAKKVWSILRIMLMMVKKGISKSKLIMDLNVLLKRGNQAINGLIIHGHNSLICRPNNDPTNYFVSPKEYEFSCSNSPAVGPIHHYLMMAHHKIKTKPKSNHRDYRYQLEDPTTVVAVHRVLEMINTNTNTNTIEVGPTPTTSSPLGGQYALPGFGNGKSPLVRQLRITDSPFPLKDGKRNVEEEEEDVKVNKAADEFIKKFYKNLRMQKSLESPCHMWAR